MESPERDDNYESDGRKNDSFQQNVKFAKEYDNHKQKRKGKMTNEKNPF